MNEESIKSLIVKLSQKISDKNGDFNNEDKQFLQKLQNELLGTNNKNSFYSLEFEQINEEVKTFATSISDKKLTKENIQSFVDSFTNFSNRIQHQYNNIIEFNKTLERNQQLSHFAYWNYEHATKTMTWSDEIFSILNIKNSNEKFSLGKYVEFIHPEDLDKTIEIFRNSIDNKTPFYVTHRIRLQDGTIKNVEESGVTEYDKNGNPIRTIGAIQDLNNSIINNYIAKDILSYGHLGIAIISGKNNPNEIQFQYVNKAFGDLLGYHPEELLNQPLKIIYHKNDWAKSDMILNHIQENKLYNYNAERQLIHKNGAIIDVDLNVTPIWSNSKIDIIILKTIDISELKKSQDKLNSSIEQIELINTIINQSTVVNKPIEDILFNAIRLLTQHTHFDLGSFCEYEDENWNSSSKWYKNDQSTIDLEHSVKDLDMNCIIALQRLLENKNCPIWINKQTNNTQSNNAILNANFNTLLALPIWKEGKIKYILKIFSKSEIPENKSILNLCKSLSKHLSSIIEKKDSESKKIKAESYFQLLSENSLDIVVLHDPDGKVIWHSPSVDSILKYEKNSLIGINAFDLLHPDDVQKAYDNLLAPFKDENSTSNSIDARLRKKDGTYLWFNFLTKPIFKDGEIVNIISSLREVTDKIKTKEELKRNELKFRSIVEFSADIITISNTEGKVTYISPNIHTITGISVEDFLAKTNQEYFPEEYNYHVQKAFDEAIADFNKVGTVTYQFQKKNGELIWLESSFRKVILENEEVVIGNSRDVSERINHINHKNKLLKEQEVLIREIHHRVKNNLQIISGLIQMQKRRVNNEVTSNELTATASRIQSISLIHEMLYQSELFSEINLKKYLENLSNTIINTYKSTDKEIKISTNFENIIIGIEKALPLGILTNEVLTNPLKHAFTNGEPSPEVKMSLSKNENIITYKIEDNGKGMDTNNIDKKASLGMKLIDGLSYQLNSDFTIQSEIGKGVKTIITFEDKEEN